MLESNIDVNIALEPTQTITDAPQTNLGADTPGTTSEGTQKASSFVDSLNQELRNIPALKNFKDVDSLAKSYIHANSLLGKKLQELSPEELKVAFGKMNEAPESIDGYKLQGSEVLKQEVVDFYKELGFGMKLNQGQMEMFINKMAELEGLHQNQVKSNMETFEKESRAELEKDWGKLTDQKINLAEKAVLELGGPDLKAELEKQGLLKHPGLLKAFAKAGEGLMETGFAGETGNGMFSMTPEQAKAATKQKLMSTEFREAYFNNRHPAHKEAVKEMSELYSLAGGNE